LNVNLRKQGVEIPVTVDKSAFKEVVPRTAAPTASPTSPFAEWETLSIAGTTYEFWTNESRADVGQKLSNCLAIGESVLTVHHAVKSAAEDTTEVPYGLHISSETKHSFNKTKQNALKAKLASMLGVDESDVSLAVSDAEAANTTEVPYGLSISSETAHSFNKTKQNALKAKLASMLGVDESDVSLAVSDAEAVITTEVPYGLSISSETAHSFNKTKQNALKAKLASMLGVDGSDVSLNVRNHTTPVVTTQVPYGLSISSETANSFDQAKKDALKTKLASMLGVDGSDISLNVRNHTTPVVTTQVPYGLSISSETAATFSGPKQDTLAAKLASLLNVDGSLVSTNVRDAPAPVRAADTTRVAAYGLDLETVTPSSLNFELNLGSETPESFDAHKQDLLVQSLAASTGVDASQIHIEVQDSAVEPISLRRLATGIMLSISITTQRANDDGSYDDDDGGTFELDQLADIVGDNAFIQRVASTLDAIQAGEAPAPAPASSSDDSGSGSGSGLAFGVSIHTDSGELVDGALNARSTSGPSDASGDTIDASSLSFDSSSVTVTPATESAVEISENVTIFVSIGFGGDVPNRHMAKSKLASCLAVDESAISLQLHSMYVTLDTDMVLSKETMNSFRSEKKDAVNAEISSLLGVDDSSVSLNVRPPSGPTEEIQYDLSISSETVDSFVNPKQDLMASQLASLLGIEKSDVSADVSVKVEHSVSDSINHGLAISSESVDSFDTAKQDTVNFELASLLGVDESDVSITVENVPDVRASSGTLLNADGQLATSTPLAVAGITVSVVLSPASVRTLNSLINGFTAPDKHVDFLEAFKRTLQVVQSEHFAYAAVDLNGLSFAEMAVASSSVQQTLASRAGTLMAHSMAASGAQISESQAVQVHAPSLVMNSEGVALAPVALSTPVALLLVVGLGSETIESFTAHKHLLFISSMAAVLNADPSTVAADVHIVGGVIVRRLTSSNTIAAAVTITPLLDSSAGFDDVTAMKKLVEGGHFLSLFAKTLDSLQGGEAPSDTIDTSSLSFDKSSVSMDYLVTASTPANNSAAVSGLILPHPGSTTAIFAEDEVVEVDPVFTDDEVMSDSQENPRAATADQGASDAAAGANSGRTSLRGRRSV
jgi:predicted XRE-type DNA-binding protein